MTPRRSPAGAAGMVVIGPERFHAAMGPYLAYRAAQRPTEWASLESVIRASQGVDDPERLKRWLYRAWRERHVRYVLLVGDADVVPVRYMVLDRITPAAYDYAFYPSDLYYADVAHRDGSFDDWNARKDGFHARYFGEVRGEKNKSDPINFDRIDYRPELAVGRWPVDTEAEVSMVAGKTMAEDRAVSSDKGHGLRRAGLVYVPGWVDARGQMDRWAEKLPEGWKAAKLYGGTPKSPPADEHHVVDAAQRGGLDRPARRPRRGRRLGRQLPRRGLAPAAQCRPAAGRALGGLLDGAVRHAAALRSL